MNKTHFFINWIPVMLNCSFVFVFFFLTDFDVTSNKFLLLILIFFAVSLCFRSITINNFLNYRSHLFNKVYWVSSMFKFFFFFNFKTRIKYARELNVQYASKNDVHKISSNNGFSSKNRSNDTTHSRSKTKNKTDSFFFSWF